MSSAYLATLTRIRAADGMSSPNKRISATITIPLRDDNGSMIVHWPAEAPRARDVLAEPFGVCGVFPTDIIDELIWMLNGAEKSRILKAANFKIWNKPQDFIEGQHIKGAADSNSGPCFPTGTLVYTQREGAAMRSGYKPIEKIKKGDLVLTQSGKFNRVLNTFSYNYSGTMCKFELYSSPTTKTGDGIITICTSEHPFLVYGNSATEESLTDIIPAHAITTAHKLGITATINPTSSSANPTPPTSCDWYLIGYLTRTGYYDPAASEVRIMINILDYNNPEIYEKHFKNMPLLYYRNGNFTNESTDNKIAVLSLSPLFRPIVDHVYPNWFWHMTNENFHEFINGAITTHITRPAIFGHFKLRTALFIQLLAQHYGFIMNIERIKDAVSERYYQVTMEKTINDKLTHFKSIKSNTTYQVTDLPVYNLSVANDNTYVVNNMAVHNCVGLQWRHLMLSGIRKDEMQSGVRTDETPKSNHLIDLIEAIKNNGSTIGSHIITAHNPTQVGNTTMAPSLVTLKFRVIATKYLDCIINQNSADWIDEVPINIALYGLFNHILAKQCGLTARNLIYNVNRIHVTRAIDIAISAKIIKISNDITIDGIKADDIIIN